MPKLNQIIAIVSGRKARTQRLLTDVHRGWPPEAISGTSRTYTPKDDEGERFPNEHKPIQVDVVSRIGEVKKQLASFYDIVATQEGANTCACGDILVDGEAVLTDLPVTILLFLEKQLVDLRTFVNGLPVLPPDKDWKWDGARGCFSTQPIETLKTQKVPDVLVKYEATKEHPAQTEGYMRDVVIGSWSTTYMSSAVPAELKEAALARIENLQEAVKMARESANATEAADLKIGDRLLDYALGELTSRVQS